jgi:LacI family gluconate utilization system Gnt-I transcriptional repressor
VGVSPITISRALRSPAIVSKDLREYILKIVDEMGYVPNLVARTLASRHSGIVGVITPALHQHAFMGLMLGIEDRFRTTEFSVQYANTLSSPSQEVIQLKSFLSQKPAGIILAAAEYYDDLGPLIEAAECPVAHVTDLSQQPERLVVGLHHQAAGAATTRFLLSKGYRRIGFIGGRQDIRSRRRYEGYAQTMQAAGLFDPQLAAGEDIATSPGLGRRLFALMLKRIPDLDAVFCQNDDLALGAIIECRALGISVPQDFGVCGFNDLDFAAFIEPSLTTVHIPRYDMGYRVADMLLHAVREEPPGEDRVDLGFSIVERSSTR